ncbi:AbiJ-NTD4 domain-containing protein [Klebsiella variicola]|uniref:AbiJ-NTD4 domain-containing protein n=1 Tax=Klebsiella variicola TaxID=244366 RepID=UPI000DAD4CD1|nr:hypothetical protein [Klebsiella variicola]PZZ92631.1 hypothetical protein DMS93_11295 [Klebsiella variicola]
MKFSYRHGYDPEFDNRVVRDDAPRWVRKLFFSKVLERLLQTDQLSDSGKQPIPIYDLIYELLAMDDEEPDEYQLSHTSALEVLRNLVMGMPWYRFYDMVETVAEKLIDNDDTFTWGSPKNESYSYSAYRQRVNELFSEYKVDWRMNETGLLESPLPLFLEEKLRSTEEKLADRFEPARTHYVKARAYALGAHRDAENSIKESVSAIESVCRTFYPDACTLGDALKLMRKDGSVSPMLITVIEKFYAYANAEPAVRHGSDKASSVLEHDAELALHFAAAFIRTLILRKE